MAILGALAARLVLPIEYRATLGVVELLLGAFELGLIGTLARERPGQDMDGSLYTRTEPDLRLDLARVQGADDSAGHALLPSRRSPRLDHHPSLRGRAHASAATRNTRGLAAVASLRPQPASSWGLREISS